MNPSRTLKRVAVLATGTIVSSLVLSAVVPSPAHAVPSSGGCAQVSIITARASTEAAGEGITGALVTQVVNASAQTVSRASVSYPATLNNYNNSSLQGINALKTQLTNLVNSCPSTRARTVTAPGPRVRGAAPSRGSTPRILAHRHRRCPHGPRWRQKFIPVILPMSGRPVGLRIGLTPSRVPARSARTRDGSLSRVSPV